MAWVSIGIAAGLIGTFHPERFVACVIGGPLAFAWTVFRQEKRAAFARLFVIALLFILAGYGGTVGGICAATGELITPMPRQISILR